MGEVAPFDDKRLTHGICKECIEKFFPKKKK